MNEAGILSGLKIVAAGFIVAMLLRNVWLIGMGAICLVILLIMLLIVKTHPQVPVTSVAPVLTEQQIADKAKDKAALRLLLYFIGGILAVMFILTILSAIFCTTSPLYDPVHRIMNTLSYL